MSTTTAALPTRSRGDARSLGLRTSSGSVAAPFPTRRARREAEVRAAGARTRTTVPSQTTGAAVSPPAVPVPAPEPTSEPTSAPAPEPPSESVAAPPVDGAGRAATTRRTARSAEHGGRASSPTARGRDRGRRAASPRPALGRTVTEAITLPLRRVGRAVAASRAVPLTATAVVTCLCVSIGTPPTATAATASTSSDARPAYDAQEYVAVADAPSVRRDGFGVRVPPVRSPRLNPQIAGVPMPSGSAVRPVDGSIPAAGGFGARWVQGCAACSTNHQGLDFAAPTGTDVVAAMAGRVVSAGVSGGYGKQVLVEHPDGSATRYGHLSVIAVRTGQAVAAGERVGAVGNTGVSTGPHLHFEVVRGGVPVDPGRWLRDRGLL